MWYEIKMFFAKFLWQHIDIRVLFDMFCTITGIVSSLVGLLHINIYLGGWIDADTEIRLLFSLTISWFVFIIGIILTIFGILLSVSKPMIKELPKYKAKEEKKRIDKIFDEAGNLKVLNKRLGVKFDSLISLSRCGEEINPEAVKKLEEWIRNYEDMIAKKNRIAMLKYTEKTLPNDMKTTKIEMKKLCVKLT